MFTKGEAMNYGLKLEGQARSVASRLLQCPTHSVLVLYKHDSTAEHIKQLLCELSGQFPGMADWKQRVKFRRFDERPKLDRNRCDCVTN